ncbi:hypothetical protein GCM10017790_61900 [Amycolatopsis oliviviridis]|uniref:Uncharacterized protein n=1 Tax=Amycolatopsis oliviviridis TaxID=1471590 RepID=A0ABQ3M039_9PSEU|nr:hypothetical protein GCM10017790_61900 [Amycolatopsis oliviviridis]
MPSGEGVPNRPGGQDPVDAPSTDRWMPAGGEGRDSGGNEPAPNGFRHIDRTLRGDLRSTGQTTGTRNAVRIRAVAPL